MSDLSRKRLLGLYKEKVSAPTFLAQTFSTEERDIHMASEVELDVRRAGRPIAIVITDWKNGGRKNTLDLYTNKRWKPPVLFEEFDMNSTELLDRQPGENPFGDIEFMRVVQNKLTDGVEFMIEKIRRTLELQAAQIYQTGAINLYDKNGVLAYTVDFQMKSSHKPGASVDWDEAGADPILDMSLADRVARRNGKFHMNRWVYGDNAWNEFLNNEKVLKLLDNRSMQLGGVAPELMSEDQIYQGWVIINGVRCELYTYDASYDDPQSGNDTPYISPWNVVGLSTKAPRRATFGGIPRIVPVDSRLESLGIGSMLAPEKGLALTTNAFVDNRGENITASVATRPLLIPSAVDAHVCINAKVS